MRKTTRKRSRSSNAVPADVLSTLPELGIEIDKISGNEAWALCPGHFETLGREDHGASWSINLDTGAHNCFSCGWGGNFVDLVRWQNNWEDDPEQATAWVRKRGGISVASRKLRGETYTKKKADEVTDIDLAYLFDREIPQWALDSRGLERDSCAAYDVRWDPKNDWWIIPVRDPFTGKLRGWQEKGKDHFNNHPRYLEKADTLFGYNLLGKTAYLEESPLDCPLLHSWSIDGAVSGYGVHVSPAQINLIIDRCDTLVCCLDNDAAGRSKERRIWEEYRYSIRLFFANYDHVQGDNYKKDHGEMTPDELEYSLENPISALRYRPDANR